MAGSLPAPLPLRVDQGTRVSAILDLWAGKSEETNMWWCMALYASPGWQAAKARWATQNDPEQIRALTLILDYIVMVNI